MAFEHNGKYGFKYFDGREKAARNEKNDDGDSPHTVSKLGVDWKVCVIVLTALERQLDQYYPWVVILIVGVGPSQLTPPH